MLRPPWSRLATPVTWPAAAARWWVALISMPTVIRPGPACSAEPSEPSVSASTHDAPPWRSPSGWVLPATGMVPTTRCAVASRMVIPICSMSVFLLAAMYASVICRALSCSTATSRPGRRLPPYRKLRDAGLVAEGWGIRTKTHNPGILPFVGANGWRSSPLHPRTRLERHSGIVGATADRRLGHGRGCAPPPGPAAERSGWWLPGAEGVDGGGVEG